MTAISDKWTSLGGARSVVGDVVSGHGEGSEIIGGGTPVSFQDFQHGSIFFKTSTCAHEVHGPILDLYDTLGRQRSALGLPISDVQPARAADPTNYLFSDFEDGVIYWESASRDALTGEPGPARTFSLTPLASSVVRGASGFDPTAAGITRRVRDEIEARVQPQGRVESCRIERITDYSCEGDVVHNRQYVFEVVVVAQQGCFLSFVNPSVTLHLRIDLVYDRAARTISGFLRQREFEIHSFLGIGENEIRTAITNSLDPLVGTAVMSQTLPEGTNVLSVKVLTSGDTAIFIEPGCFISTAAARAAGVPPDHPYLGALRRFRDEHLAGLEGGAEVIGIYYLLAPQLVAVIDREPASAELYGALVEDFIFPAARLISEGSPEAVLRQYAPALRLIAAIGKLPNAYEVCREIAGVLSRSLIELVGSGRHEEFGRRVLEVLQDAAREHLPD